MAKATQQPVILTVGYTDFLLPSMANIELVLKTLASGVACRDHRYQPLPHIEVDDESRPIPVGIKIVPRGTRIVRKGDPLRLEAK